MAIDYEQIQNTIDYHFENEDLLQQAFVRRSYSEENGGQNNEILEFIGDKVLDLVVIRLMMRRFGVITDDKEWSELKLRNPKYFQTKMSEGKFTDIKKDLVQKKALAKSMENLGFHTQLIMGKGDIKNNVQNEDSVKEDLFEAIIGAVAEDCDYDMDLLTEVVSNMIDFDAYFDNEEIENVNYVGLVQNWFQKNDYGLPNYEYEEVSDGFYCYLTLSNRVKIREFGSSQAKARMNAAKNAYQYLLDNGLIEDPFKDAIGKPIFNESIRQLHELYQKGLVEKPLYLFEKSYDDDGSTLWTCTCSMDDLGYDMVETASSKKDAQKLVAYEILLDLIDEYDEDYDYAYEFLNK